MKKEYLKMSILGILIVGCIAQTMILWLGGVLSHNFLSKSVVNNQVIAPISVWLVRPTGVGQANSALAYPMYKTKEETAVEFERLNIELKEVLSSLDNSIIVEAFEEIKWEGLMNVSGIMYEYSMPIDAQQLIGVSTEINQLQVLQDIDTVFIESKNKFEDKLTIHFISTEYNRRYRVQVIGDFEEFDKIYDYALENQQREEAVQYQPSAVSNISQYIKGNKFMPIASAIAPIEYTVLRAVNPIPENTEEAIEVLDSYLESFFVNPLIKDIETREDGSIVFMENTKGFVIYEPIGSVEYVNLAPKIQSETSLLEGYSIAHQFLEQTTVIKEEDKRQYYLDYVSREDDFYTYHFNKNYEGYDIHLGEQVKNALEIECFAQITVKANQVIGAKFSVVDFEIKREQGSVQIGRLKSEYVDPINYALEIVKKDSNEEVVFEDSKIVYLYDALDEAIYLTRGVLLNEEWYYLEQ